MGYQDERPNPWHSATRISSVQGRFIGEEEFAGFHVVLLRNSVGYFHKIKEWLCMSKD
jgi:hypothetical protein